MDEPVPAADLPHLRMFPGYAGTPLWFVDGLVDPADIGLTAELAAGLTAWEDACHARGGLLADIYPPEGVPLGQALAEELGSSFAVELSLSPGGTPRILRSGGPPTNPDAAYALRTLAEEARIRREESNEGPWYACAPRSGAVFTGRSDVVPEP